MTAVLLDWIGAIVVGSTWTSDGMTIVPGGGLSSGDGAGGEGR